MRARTAATSGSDAADTISRSCAGVRLPAAHWVISRRRVALVDRLAGEDPVALVEDAVLVLEDREVLVLERVVVLVGEGEPLVAAGLTRLGAHVEPALVIAVDADDPAPEQIERQVAQAGVRGNEAKRLVQPFQRSHVFG